MAILLSRPITAPFLPHLRSSLSAHDSGMLHPLCPLPSPMKHLTVSASTQPRSCPGTRDPQFVTATNPRHRLVHTTLKLGCPRRHARRTRRGSRAQASIRAPERALPTNRAGRNERMWNIGEKHGRKQEADPMGFCLDETPCFILTPRPTHYKSPNEGAGVVQPLTGGQVWGLCDLGHVVPLNLSNVCLGHGLRERRKHKDGGDQLLLLSDSLFTHFK